MKKLLVPSILCAALTLTAAVRLSGEILEQVLVKVNGDIITKTELEKRQVSVLRSKLNGQVDPATMKNDEQLKKMLAEVTPEVLVNSVDELLLLQRGRELGFHLGDEQFKQVVANIRKEQGLQDEQKFQAALRQEGMTVDDLRQQLERQMIIEQVQRQEVGTKLTITEAEAKQVLRAASGGVHGSGVDHAPRDSDRSARDQGSQRRRRRQRRGGRGGERRKLPTRARG